MSVLPGIDQLVIVMLENRSFDSLLGYFSLDQWKNTRSSPVNGLQTAKLSSGYVNPAADNTPRNPFAVTVDNLLASDLPHDRYGIMSQLDYDTHQNVLRMDGFVRAQYRQGPTPQYPSCMGYFTPDLVPMTNFLATEYKVCDRWFSAIPADTHPNRLMSLSGYTNIDTTGSLTRQQPTVVSYFENIGKRNSITVYAKRASFYSMLYDYAIEALTGSTRFKRWEAFATDWNTPPTDPHVWVVEPGYADSPMCSWMTQGPPDDGHPPAPIAFAERFLYDVYTTVLQNPARWARTLMVVTFDEHGGFFDHEPPLMIPTPAPQPNVYPDFPCTGVRVPALLVSPFVTRGSTFSYPMDHTSLLRMVADKFGGGLPFGPPVAARPVHSVWDAVDLSAARIDKPIAKAPPPLPPTPIPTDAGSPVARAFLSALRYVELAIGRSLS